jgi:hypothetical protein
MQLIKIINTIMISLLFITAVSHANDEEHLENTIIDNKYETRFYNLKNTRSYKMLNWFPEHAISNFPDFTGEIKNRIIASVPTFTTIAMYCLLCMYLDIIPYDNLFNFATKLLLIDYFFAATNILIKPNTILNLISMFYYIYNDMISPVYMMSAMMSSFDIGLNLSSALIVSSLLANAVYIISIKINNRCNLVNRIIKENKNIVKDSVEINDPNYANNLKILHDLINNNSNVYLYNNNITDSDNFYMRVFSWFNDTRRLSLCDQKKEIKTNLEIYLSKYDSVEVKNKCMLFLKKTGVALLSADCKQLTDVIFIPSERYKLLFEFKKQPNKITSSNLISLLKSKDVLNVEINGIESPEISNSYNSFIIARDNKSYYLLINYDIFNANYIFKVMLFFASFNNAKINIFNSTDDNSIIIKYNNTHQIREALKTIIKIFNCNSTNTALYKISGLNS